MRFEVRITTSPLSVRLPKLERYDLIVFTSKNAQKFFTLALHKYKTKIPKHARVVRVGPRAELLKLELKNKKILFPRSDLAPFAIIRQLRARGAQVRVLPLYTTDAVLLTKKQKESLLEGAYRELYFKSPSGVTGFLQQFNRIQQKQLLSIPALCIGTTTASAAKAAGFKKVSIRYY